MAFDPKSLVYGGQEGSGAAQIFDTSGANKWEIAKIQKQAEVDAQNQENKKNAIDAIETDIDIGQPWNKHQQLVDEGYNNVVNEATQLAVSVRNGRIDPESDEYYRRFNEIKKKERLLNSLVNSTNGAKEGFNNAMGKLTLKDANKYYNIEESKNMLSSYANPEVEGDSWEERAKGVMAYYSQNDPGVSLRSNFDFSGWGKKVRSDLKAAGKASGTYLKDGKWQVNEESVKYLKRDFITVITGEYMNNIGIKDYIDKQYGENIEGWDDMSPKQKAMELSENEEFVSYVLPKDEVKQRGVFKEGFGWGFGDEDGSTAMSVKTMTIPADNSADIRKKINDKWNSFSPRQRSALKQIGMTKSNVKDASGYYGDAVVVSVSLPATKDASINLGKDNDIYISQGAEELFEEISTNGSFSVGTKTAEVFGYAVDKDGNPLTEDELSSGNYNKDDIKIKYATMFSGESEMGSGQLGFTAPLDVAKNVLKGVSESDIEGFKNAADREIYKMIGETADEEDTDETNKYGGVPARE